MFLYLVFYLEVMLKKVKLPIDLEDDFVCGKRIEVIKTCRIRKL